MSKYTEPDKIGQAISRELTLYGATVVEGIKKTAKNYMAQLVKETKETAPVGHRTKHYRDSISGKKVEDTFSTVKYVWYVDGPDYRLSHLLEKGHALRDGGRTEGTHFIQNASDRILAEYIRAVEEVIENG